LPEARARLPTLLSRCAAPYRVAAAVHRCKRCRRTHAAAGWAACAYASSKVIPVLPPLSKRSECNHAVVRVWHAHVGSKMSVACTMLRRARHDRQRGLLCRQNLGGCWVSVRPLCPGEGCHELIIEGLLICEYPW